MRSEKEWLRTWLEVGAVSLTRRFCGWQRPVTDPPDLSNPGNFFGQFSIATIENPTTGRLNLASFRRDPFHTPDGRARRPAEPAHRGRFALPRASQRQTMTRTPIETGINEPGEELAEVGRHVHVSLLPASE
jgi:hypothetical protein